MCIIFFGVIMKSDEYYMKIAIKEAIKASNKEEIPVGAIVVNEEGKIIGRGHNIKETSYKTIGHAEIEAITKANKKINNWRLLNCTIYVTLEPCNMCKNVIKESKIKRVVYCLKNNSSNIGNDLIQEQITNESLIDDYNLLLKDLFHKIRS